MSNLQIIDIWQKTLEQIEPQVSKLVFDTWIKAIIPIKIQNKKIILGVPKSFIKDWIEDNYLNKISLIINTILNENFQIDIVNLDIEESQQKEPFVEQKIIKINKPLPSEDNFFKQEDLISTLNSKYTFDSFVIGNSNRFAHAASLAVSETPGKVYNPLFMYGGVGLGKTHLMHAIGQKVKEKNPDSKVLYISSEKFTNELINSIRDGSTEKFRQKYRNIDCLLIDDIQFLAKKEHTQEEFFHTFNTLYDANKQIVISSDRPPKEIPTLEERLSSRFEWGLTADVQPPDIETRIAIIRKKAQIDNLEIPNDVAFFIASKIENNIRELEGCLLKVIAYSSLNKLPITLDMTQIALKNIINTDINKPITIEKIQDIVANHYKIKKEDLLAKKRTKNIVYPRQIAIYLCRELTDYSLPKIGDLFGGRDHTTIIHSIEKIVKDIQKDSQLEQDIKSLKNKLNS